MWFAGVSPGKGDRMRLLPRHVVQRISDETPPDRDRYADLLRFGAILMVVLGHWIVAVVLVEDGAIIRTTELIVLVPQTRPITWVFQVMPLFFLVGGAVNAGSWRRAMDRGEPWPVWVRRRSRRLMSPLLPLLGVWVPVAVVLAAAGLPERYVGLGMRTAFIPVWFLAVYLGLVALVPVTSWLHRRVGVSAIVLAVVLAALVDVLHRADVPAVGYLNYLLIWGSCHQLGYLWADGRLPSRPSRAVVLLVAAALVTALLVSLPQYSSSMVQATGDDGNTGPPSVALFAFSVAQLGLVLTLRDPVQRWLQRPGVWAAVVLGGSVTMTIFLWHMTALVLAVALTHPTGLWPDTPVVDGAWWALRPLWVLLCGVLLGALTAVFRRFEQSSDPVPRTGRLRAVAGLAATVAGLAMIMVSGIYQPDRTAGVPIGPLGLFLTGLGALGVLRPGSRTSSQG
jgi:fucose 4-O-acetylase-like acetyltransferase